MQLNLNLKLFKPEVVYMTGVGHGSPHVYTGHNGMPIFKKGRYLREEVENKVVHFLSCYTAQILGPNFVKYGCRAYFGYSQAFVVSDLNYKDIFFRCDGEIDIAFADGNQARILHSSNISILNSTFSKNEISSISLLNTVFCNISGNSFFMESGIVLNNSVLMSSI